MNEGSDIRGIQATIHDISTKVSMLKELVDNAQEAIVLEDETNRWAQVNEYMTEASTILNELDDRS